MGFLLHPAIALTSRLRYAQKFTLLGLLVLLAIGSLQVSLYRALDRVIEPSRQELEGIDDTKLEKLVLEVQEKYVALDDYGVAEYSMAAKVRFGESLSLFAEKMAQSPTPKYVLDLDKRNPDAGAVAAYEEGLAKNLAKYVELAKAQWTEVVRLLQKIIVG